MISVGISKMSVKVLEILILWEKNNIWDFDRNVRAFDRYIRDLERNV